MTEAAKEARRAYYREYYRKNRERMKTTAERYWARKAEATAAAQKASGGEADANSR